MLACDFVRQRIGETFFLQNVKLGNFAGRVVAIVRLHDASDLAKGFIR